MRVLAVTNMYPTCRTPAFGTFVAQQINGLKRIGLDVELIFADRARRGMRIYLGLAREVRAKIENLQPDVIHVMYGGVMADQVTRTVNDRPTVVTFHGSDLLGEHLSGYLRKLIAGYGVRSSWRAARRADGIVTVSKALRDALPDDVDRSKVKIIPCGIDLELFRPLNRDTCCSRIGWRPDAFHILFLANDPVKRPGLARAGVVTFNRLGIQGVLHELRGVPHKEVSVWLNASDALLLTSLHEGSPTIVKEALACNLPVISVDVGDVRERINGIEGCYLALPDPNDLAAKLCLVYSGIRRVAGRAKMKELSLEHIALRLKMLYDEVLLSWRGKSKPDLSDLAG